jgi:hypothetical protein
MSLTVTYKDNKFSLVGKDGRTYDVSAAQQQQWQQTLNGLATQHGLKDAQDLLNKGTVAVPEAGDSQWRMATEAGIAPQNINASVVALNEHIDNPDLIQTYRPGDLTPDFVMLPVPPEEEPILGSDAPAGMPAPTPGNTKPADFAQMLAKEPDEKKRAGLIDGYFKASDDPKKTANDLLKLDFGKDINESVRREIIRTSVEGKKPGEQLQALKDLAEVNWKDDVAVDTQILAVAKELGFSRDQVGTINEGVK